MKGRISSNSDGICISVEFIFDDICQDIFHLKTSSLNLLRYKAGCGHTRSSINFKHVYLVHFFTVFTEATSNDIVDTDNTVAVEYIIDMAGYLTDTLCCLFTQACRRNFLHLSVVFGIIIEELIIGNNLSDREHYRFLLGLIASAGNLSAFEISFHHHLITFKHRLADSRRQLVNIIHLGNTKATAVSGGLNETRHADTFFNFLVTDKLFISLTNKQAVSYAHTETTQILVQDKLIECHCFHQHTACRIRKMNQFEITLQDTIFTRSSVNCDISEIRLYEFPVFHKRKVITVYLCCHSIT